MHTCLGLSCPLDELVPLSLWSHNVLSSEVYFVRYAIDTTEFVFEIVIMVYLLHTLTFNIYVSLYFKWILVGNTYLSLPFLYNHAITACQSGHLGLLHLIWLLKYLGLNLSSSIWLPSVPFFMCSLLSLFMPS